ncbi:MAG: PIG-L family deacetylase [Myxococcaceae bacterium]|nr:PIG-L family deacetylase [Myxococcaceae bacterium]
MSRRTLALMSLLTSTMVFAGSAPPRRDGAQLLQQVRKLSVLGSALFVAAHPDDENTRLLATLANETLVRTTYLAFTRGEGGQNLIGPELGPLLGVIRTQELLAARRVDGAEQVFTRARDFGFSKSVDETLAIWDHDRVLADAVYAIRALQPDVIITRFALEGGDTHGHHTASARLALEAFKAAADPAFHPEQLKSVSVWQAKRIVRNAWAPDGKPTGLPPETLTWDSSPYSPLHGLTYGELAAESRSMHKSQGFGAAPLHGPNPEFFVPLAGDVAQKTLFDGVELTWKRVPGAEKVAALLAKAAQDFKVDAPHSSVPALLSALEELRKLPRSLWVQRKEQELVEVIAACAGVFVEAAAAAPTTVPGAKVEVVTQALVRAGTALTFSQVRVGEAQDSGAKAKLLVDAPARLTSPFFLEQPPAKGTWTLDDTQPFNAPQLPAALEAEFTFKAGTQSLVLSRDVVFKWVDPTVGERTRPLEVLPPVVVKLSEPLLAFTDQAPRPLVVTVVANADAQSGSLPVTVPDGFTVSPPAVAWTLAKKGDEVQVALSVKRTTAKAVGELSLDARTLTRVEHAHIPMQVVLAPARVKLVPLELKRGRTKKVGYIVGAGDDVPQALRQAGYAVTVLGDEALKAENLGAYDAIVVGIRAYNVNPRLIAAYPRLMQYVKDGGVLVAQYNTKNWLSSVPAKLGPYPLELSQDRVTDEDAEVVFASPRHPVLSSPNALGPADFTGWVQERGLYFASKFDARYETPLSMHDPGEKPLQGSLLVAKSGKGRFVYTGLAFFRQLPAGVPGAYRLFANLLDRGS